MRRTGVKEWGTKKVLTMKILINKKSNKVLYGEAGKDVVDFLVNLLSFPVGAVIKLLEDSNNGMVGSAAKIYNSVRTIDASYLHNDVDKKKLLLQLTSVRSPATSATSHLFLEHNSSTPKQYYLCSEVPNLYSGMQFPQCHFGYVSDVYKAQCPGCKRPMTKAVKFVKGVRSFDENEWIEGVVKGVATYMVMDDLSFTPLSMIAGIGVLNKLNINIRDVEERTVEIGMEEGLQLLKASLQSKTALSDVFMVEKETVVSPASRKRKYKRS